MSTETEQKELPQVFQDAGNLLLYLGGGHLKAGVQLAVDELKHLQELLGGRRLEGFDGHGAREAVL